MTVLSESGQVPAQYCEGLEQAGYDDWRAPRVDELRTIADYDQYSPAVDSVFSSNSSWYWSGSGSAGNSVYAWDDSTEQIIFEDNFDDEIIDDSKWYLSCGGKNRVDGNPGQTVEEIGGILRVAADATDNWGIIISQPITIDPSQLITIERRIKVHCDNNYCGPRIFILDQDENSILIVHYYNYHYNSDKYYFGFNDANSFDPISELLTSANFECIIIFYI